MPKITDEELRSLRGPNQIFYEWKLYLQFIKTYFEKQGIVKPLVVEIGTQCGRQKAFYERFLGAEHIGIDISAKDAKPDILGDSHAPETMAKLLELLGDRKINLLFIDATHNYKDALAEYENYGPLATDIIAMHDVRHVAEIGQLWKDIQVKEKDNYNISFHSIGAWGGGWCELGIGLIIKHNRTDLKAIVDGFRVERLDG
jgi:hypothetical protein